MPHPPGGEGDKICLMFPKNTFLNIFWVGGGAGEENKTVTTTKIINFTRFV